MRAFLEPTTQLLHSAPKKGATLPLPGLGTDHGHTSSTAGRKSPEKHTGMGEAQRMQRFSTESKPWLLHKLEAFLDDELTQLGDVASQPPPNMHRMAIFREALGEK